MHFIDRLVLLFENFFLLFGECVAQLIAILAHKGEQVFELPVLNQKSDD